MIFILTNLIKTLILIVPLLIAIAYFTLFERKIIGGIHRRRGPDVVGFWGLLQPLADGLKLIIKETVLPSSANTVIFVSAPIVAFILSLISWTVIPFSENWVYADLNLGVLFLFAISSLSVYGIVISGWSSNSKYAFLGGLRSAAQIVSYEVSIGFIIFSVILCTGSSNLTTITLSQTSGWYILPLFPMFVIFFISALAETNRHPFDLPEAEAELVSGYNVEYSAAGFALFFLGEYSNIILISAVTSIFFLGGWLPILNILPFTLVPGVVWLAVKAILFIALFVWVRAAYPRYRYDQLIRLGWKVFLPLALGYIVFVSGFLESLNFLPYHFI
jgi:NADH-quinone oxidoreductase subunit H